MITRSLLLLSTLALLTVCVDKASASPVFQGKATTGEEVYLETDSIDSTNQSAVKFEYKIGKSGKKFDLVKASANCFNGVISPQNPGDFPAYQPNATGATRKMYNVVCQGINDTSNRESQLPESNSNRKLEDPDSSVLKAISAVSQTLAETGNRFATTPQERIAARLYGACSDMIKLKSSPQDWISSLGKISNDEEWISYDVYITMAAAEYLCPIVKSY